MQNQKYSGLTQKEIADSIKEHGANTLPERQKRTLLSRFIESLGDPIIKILLAALAINVLLLAQTSDWLESLGIALAVLLATVLSVISEAGSEKAFERLQEDANKKQARVIRGGNISQIPASRIVCGDIILLQAGEAISADGVVLEGDFSVNQASLNGESKECKKHPTSNTKEIISDDNALFLMPNKVFSGTIVTHGEGIMRAVAVGAGTAYGALAHEIQHETTASPLKERLGKFAQTISRIGTIASALVAFSYLANQIFILHNFNNWLDILNHAIKSLTIAVSVIVMSVPEGLPMMITIVLARNMKNMLKDNVLVRKLVGIETAGSINLLFTDKTGTLTRGVLSVDEVKLGANVNENEVRRAIALNSSAEFSKDGIIGGNATDRALLQWCGEAKHNAEILERKPFDSRAKFMSTKVKEGGKMVAYLKGAPEILFPNMPQNGTKRTIAIAREDAMSGRKLLANITLKDALRPQTAETVHEIQSAGVNIIMITGDAPQTATEIAKECGIIRNAGDITLTSQTLAKMTDGEIGAKLSHIKVVARALPSDKSRLVRIAQSYGLVVGMTGDGVNDAPALKKADVGFAMGSGTEVAKEAGDIVILDDNLSSIAKAICFGRTIFKNIRKFIAYQLTVSMGAVGISIIGPFIGINNPITVIQMLWINIVMDTLAALAFAGEMALKRYMKEKPKHRNEPILTRQMWGQIVLCGVSIAFLCIFFLIIPDDIWGGNGEQKATAFFALFMFLAIFMSFNARTESRNLIEYLAGNKAFIAIMSLVLGTQIAIIYFGGEIFRTRGLPIGALAIIVGISALILPIDILRKKITLRRHIGR